MSPFVAYHATVFRHRESIRKYGLLAAGSNPERFGVYVFREDYGHPTFSRTRACVRWGHWPPNDLWQVSYIGPMSPDHYVENGLILHYSVPPQHLVLITGITPNSGGVK